MVLPAYIRNFHHLLKTFTYCTENKIFSINIRHYRDRIRRFKFLITNACIIAVFVKYFAVLLEGVCFYIKCKLWKALKDSSYIGISYVPQYKHCHTQLTNTNTTGCEYCMSCYPGDAGVIDVPVRQPGRAAPREPIGRHRRRPGLPPANNQQQSINLLNYHSRNCFQTAETGQQFHSNKQRVQERSMCSSCNLFKLRRDKKGVSSVTTIENANLWKMITIRYS